MEDTIISEAVSFFPIHINIITSTQASNSVTYGDLKDIGYDGLEIMTWAPGVFEIGFLSCTTLKTGLGHILMRFLSWSLVLLY
jgi:hypothetical protein